jgi:hypothetical protein
VPTPEQQGLIDRLTVLLKGELGAKALWLAGSLGRGAGDAWSDVDLLVLAGEGAAVALSTAVGGRLGAAVTPVLVLPLYGGRVLSVVTDGWQRFDLTFVEPADLRRYEATDLIELFNLSDVSPPTRPQASYRPSPETLLALVREFMRVVGLTPLGLARGEYELGLSGVDILRRLTLDLMLEENGVSPAARGGALKRNPFLTDAQRADLATVPPQSASREGVLGATLAFAAIFLPRARRLASEIGAAWPSELEEALRRHLRRTLGVTLP